MSEMRVLVKTLRAGQPRPYADTEYVFEVSGQYWWDSTTGPRFSDKYRLDENTALGYALVNHNKKMDWKSPEVQRTVMKNEKRSWCDEYIDYIKETRPGVWEIRFVTPYDD